MSCAKARAHGPETVGRYCRKCAELEHGAGVIFYRGRYADRAAVIERLMKAPEMRGVVWAEEGDRLVGRKGAFTISLKRKAAP